MSEVFSLQAIGNRSVQSTTDLVFEELYQNIIQLRLPPGTKISEADVAAQLDVSRQPVRDAFYRLARLSLIQIRPQRATQIAPISVRQVEHARFIRTSIELETIRLTIERLDDESDKALAALMDRQLEAVEQEDKTRFHELDDELHRVLCEIAGHEEAWNLIRDNKAHMDRVRYISLSFGTRNAYDEHCRLLAHIRSGNLGGAQDELRTHLGNIHKIIAQVRQTHTAYFEDDKNNAPLSFHR